MFLGGVGEIGKNMTAFEYGNDIVIVDAGMSFPTAEMPGVDIVIPDITYLKENQSKIRGLLLTHGHEDHIGGVPYLLKELDIPVYGSRLTLALVENKLVEHEIFNYRLHLVDESSQVQLGVFKAEFVHVCHSIADSMAIALKTPVGTVFLTGDFKIDYTPIGGQVMNIHRIAELGKNGVTVLMAESTNVERAGYTMSEVVVTDTLRKVFNSNVGRRLIIATFASNVDRVQQIIDISKECGRKVAFGGRSMSKVVDTAKKAGVLNFDERDVVDIEKVNNVPDGEICILSTGTQGEPMSALTRMASGQFNKINIGKNDTIVISASPIPGNEKDVYKVINNLYRLGATVIYSSLADVHVSGHACREELKLMHSLLKPKFFIPIHGEYRHLCQHARLAESLGMDENNIVIPEIGSVIEVTNRKIAKKDQIPSGIVLVDGLTVGDVGKDLLKDRRTLAEEGIVLVLVGVDTTQGIVTSGPEIISRGCIYTGDDSNSRTVEDLKNLANTALQEIDLKELNVTITKQLIQKPIKSYFRKKYDRYPMIIPIILEN
ncbi:MAG: ribonuclease J [Clostridiales bacterium]|nr:ribonuclease J [Clostridiales bacterium]MDD7507016.1 ribonuclease J [Clostridiales bacterium]MDY5726072.1 ribonuclease J [Eubacteriales bacterium]